MRWVQELVRNSKTMFRAFQTETVQLRYSLPSRPASHQWVVELNNWEDFFQIFFPASSQKPPFMGRTSPKSRAHILREGDKVQEALSEGIFSKQGGDSHGLSPSGHA